MCRPAPPARADAVTVPFAIVDAGRGRPSPVAGRLRPDLTLESLLEALDLACGVDDVLRARVERVAVAADVDAELGTGRADDPLAAARAAVDLGLEVLR